MTDPEIILSKELESDQPIIIEGFPGVGLIGNIVSHHIIRETEMEQVGVIDSEDFPPIAMIYDGEIKLPVRIYNKEDFIIITSDIPISASMSNRFAKKIIEWAKGINTKKLISIGGISTMKSDKNRVFSASYSKDEIKELKELTEIFSSGNISGVSGSFLTQSKLSNLPALCLLGETERGAPDPRAAVSVIEVLNEKYGLNVETEELIDQAEKIEKEMEKVAERMKQVKGDDEKAAAPSPMYR